MINNSVMTNDRAKEGEFHPNNDSGYGTTSIAILLLAVFVMTLVGAIAEVGGLASLRPLHLTSLLLIVTCFSAWSTYRSHRRVSLLLLNLGLLGICVTFVALFVFLAVSPPIISQD